MAFESLTDAQISDLLSCPKRLTNPNAKAKIKEGHEQYNFKVEATDGSGHEFLIYKRQNLRLGMENDFSCGISWLAPNGESFTLRRYNGSSHSHPNFLEKEKLGYFCHIHLATEKYIKANRKAEGFAEISDRYNTVNGALHCLVIDCNVKGITTASDINNQPTLF